MAHDSLAGVLGRNAVDQFLVPQNIVRHIVVTVDNLPRHRVAVDLRPVKPTAGQTVTSTQGDITTLSEANFERYAPLVRVVQGADVKALAVVYQRLYPLFQQAYEDLGYPGKYFNDRLVEVIDQLLQAPEVPGADRAGAAEGVLGVRRQGPGEPLGGTEAADPHGPGQRARHQGEAARVSRRDREEEITLP